MSQTKQRDGGQHPEGEAPPLTGKPAARANDTEAQLNRANETGLNTDSRGGPGSAARQGKTTEPGVKDVSTEPREGTRLEHHTSQGLAGAQGSGGGVKPAPDVP